jgi:selenide,water dikinase
MQTMAKGAWIDAAIQSMLRSNQAAVEVLRRFQVEAVTDVTGFGLAGHLGEMLRLSQLGARLEIEQLPLLPGVKASLEAGVLSSLDPDNRQAVRDLGLGIGGGVREAILYDPQTSGGLLCAVEGGRGQALAVALHKVGYPEACCIGVVTDGGPRITAL